MPTTLTDVLRILVIMAVLGLLIRASRAAWRRRGLTVAIWRAVGLRHVLGSAGLVVLILGVVVVLVVLVPPTRIGLGQLIGLEGNAVFAPIDDALDAPLDAAAQPGSPDTLATGVPWTDLVAVTSFLGLLVMLFPHLAHAEEAAFRAGWEDLTGWQRVVNALRFGVLHLIMLIPLAAALAVALAGYVYGRIYLRAYRRAVDPRLVPGNGPPGVAEDDQGRTRLVMGPPSPVTVVDRQGARRQAVFAAAVWHTTFNTTIAVLVWVGYALFL